MTSTETVASAVAQEPATDAFPSGFIWGASTAAYQIEGAVREDGRGTSIWDTFSHTPGKTANGDTGDTAADHYHRSAGDVALMAELGIAAYRFSIAWPRIVPDGSGRVNQKGVDFYARLVDDLLEHGIVPIATLYHWDLPQRLQDEGGWANRDTASRFGEYAAVVGAALGDRIPTFTTLNEPWCSAYLGYGTGVHAPGLTDPVATFRALHHLNLAHGLAARALRTVLPASGQVSLTLNLMSVRPATDSPEDLDAARHLDGLSNRLFLEPVLRGRYPLDIIEDTRSTTDWAFVKDGDLAAISAPLDVLGVNYYSPAVVGAVTGGAAVSPRWVNDPANDHQVPSTYPGSDWAIAMPMDVPKTGMDWAIDATGLSDLLRRLHRDYPEMPLLVTENGAAFDDVVTADGHIHDAERIAYLVEHVRAVRDAIESGVDVRGYFVWSLMDNFEWAWGYSQRFGILHVDYETQRRRPKDSAYWYRDVVATNGAHALE